MSRPDDDRRIDNVAKTAMEAVIAVNGRASGKYALIVQAVVDEDASVASWNWYWNPES